MVKNIISAKLDYITKSKKALFNVSIFELSLSILMFSMMVIIPLFLKGFPNGYNFYGNPFNKKWVESVSTLYNTWDIILTFAAGLGIIGALMLSKKSKYSWIILLFEAILYGSSSFFVNKAYALGSINMFVVPVILIMTQITWKKHQTKGVSAIETRKLSIKDAGILISAMLVLTSILGVIFVSITSGRDKWYVWVDSFMGALSIFAFILSAFRFRETWYLFFVANFVKVITFSILIVDNPSEAGNLILAVGYLSNALYGMWIWQRSKEEKLKEFKLI